MEEAPAENLYRNAKHPYTRLLFSAASRGPLDGVDAKTAAAETAPSGEVKTATERITGCAFAERCPLAEERCLRERPAMRTADNGGFTRCHKVQAKPDP
jgi:oligopeptide/dipeptide ABC transporter ATP-binding protein